MTFSYMLYCLNIILPFPCDILPRAEAGVSPDVTVVYGKVPMELSGTTASDNSWKFGFSWQAAPGQFLVKAGGGCGRFLVEGGNRVTVHRHSDAGDEQLLFFILHPVAAALFRQRGLLPLHACAANVAGGAVVLCGDSAAGKSTTLAALLRNGSKMISDDLTLLRLGDGGVVEVFPGPPKMHLWDDAAHALDFDVSLFGRHPRRAGKAALPPPTETDPKPTPLRKVYILEPGPEDRVSVSRLRGAEVFNTLLRCIYGPILPEQHPDLFSIVSATARQASVFLMLRPEQRWSLDEVVKAILDE